MTWYVTLLLSYQTPRNGDAQRSVPVLRTGRLLVMPNDAPLQIEDQIVQLQLEPDHAMLGVVGW